MSGQPTAFWGLVIPGPGGPFGASGFEVELETTAVLGDEEVAATALVEVIGEGEPEVTLLSLTHEGRRLRGDLISDAEWERLSALAVEERARDREESRP